ncbi:MAG TPA: mucoidy inhibitor MuiA family protein [Tenuifilaceae bacterium]|nr:mucoidy inhibitor MuiA family protein [Tenuifilaceae bacterium]
MKKAFITLLSVALAIGVSVGQNQQKLDTKLKEVTVFTSGAQVKREATLALAKGENKLVFTNLPVGLDQQSIQLTCGDATIISIDFTINRTDGTELSPSYIALKKRSEELQEQINLERTLLGSIDTEKEMLLANKDISGQQGVKPEDLKIAMAYFRDKLRALETEKLEKNRVVAKLQEELSVVGNQMRDIMKGEKKESGELTVVLDSEKPASVPATLSYFINQAGWFPLYDIRVESVEQPIDLTFKANVYQSTGEDWKKIKLSISSGNPQDGNIYPQLLPWYLGYNNIRIRGLSSISNTASPNYNITKVYGRVISSDDGLPMPGASITVPGTTIGTLTDASGRYQITVPQGTGYLQVAYIGFATATVPITSSNLDITLNSELMELEEVVVMAYGSDRRKSESAPKAKAAPRPKPVATTQVEYSTSVNFQIDIPYDVPSTGRPVQVTLNQIELTADYQYIAAPKVTPAAYLMASITDWQKHNLIDGEANLYFEDKYIGRTLFEVKNAGDTLSLSLGKDESISIKRTKTESFREKNFIGNRATDRREFEIAIRNGKKQPIKIKISDQLPVSTNEEIKIKDVNVNGAQRNAENGLIDWTLTVNPAESKTLKFGYAVEYPKNQVIALE